MQMIFSVKDHTLGMSQRIKFIFPTAQSPPYTVSCPSLAE